MLFARLTIPIHLLGESFRHIECMECHDVRDLVPNRPCYEKHGIQKRSREAHIRDLAIRPSALIHYPLDAASSVNLPRQFDDLFSSAAATAC